MVGGYERNYLSDRWLHHRHYLSPNPIGPADFLVLTAGTRQPLFPWLVQ